MRRAGPKVSVLIPVYNAERYLSPSIESILHQSFNDFEVLLMDDGSTDGSWEIIQAASAKDERIVPLQFAHSGYAHLLNQGLLVARGEFIARMDADDVSLPARFEKQLAFLDKNPQIQVVGTAFRVLFEGVETDLVNINPQDPADVFDAMVKGSCCVGHPTAMFRKEAVRAVEGYRPHFLPAEDYDLWLRLLLVNVDAIANLPEPLLLYRVHPMQVSTTKAMQQIIGAQMAMISYRSVKAGKPDPFLQKKMVSFDELLPYVSDPKTLICDCIVNMCSRWNMQKVLHAPPQLIDAMRDDMDAFATQYGLGRFVRAQRAIVAASATKEVGWRYVKVLCKVALLSCLSWHAFVRFTRFVLRRVGLMK